MATTQDYINQLKIDKQNLVSMLNTMGVEANNNETFTALTPKVGKIVTDPILQDKTIEITENGTQTIAADEGYNGLNNVEVVTNVASSGADFKITDGSYMFQYGYRKENIYDLLPFLKPTTCLNMFDTCKMTTLDLRNLDTSDTTDMSQMFKSNGNTLTTLDLSGWNISKVTKTNYMFDYCSILTTLNLSGWNNNVITGLVGMFRGCSNLTSIDLSGIYTNKITSMNYLFYNCSKLTKIDIRNFDFSKVTAYNYMFDGIPTDCEIIVKDETAKAWVLARRSDLTNVKTVAEL